MITTPIDDLSIVIPAAGQGLRLGLGPKALLKLDGHSLLYWISAKARKLSRDVVVAIPKISDEDWEQHCPGCRIVQGGESHLETMALLAQEAKQDWVMNLNVSMPFTSMSLIRSVVNEAKEFGIAGAFISANLPIAQIKNGIVSEILPSQNLAIASGPNAYLRQDILRLIEKASHDDWQRQSFLEIANHYGMQIKAVPGEKNNIKLTNQGDWEMAQNLKDFLR